MITSRQPSAPGCSTAVLQSLELVDAPVEASFDNLTRLARTLLAAPVALVSIVDFEQSRQFFKSQQGLVEPWASERQTPLTHSFCQHVVCHNRAFVVANANEDERVCQNPAVDQLNVKAYLGVPISLPETEVPVGALCVVDSKPRDWTDQQVEQLKQLGACVSDLLKLRFTQQSLGQSNRRLRQSNASLQDFASVVSHDIQAPLRRIRSFGELLACEYQEALDQEGRTYLDFMVSGAAKLQTLVRDLLHLARWKAQDHQPTEVDAGIAAKAAVQCLQTEIANASAEVTIDDLPHVYVEQPNLVQMFEHLISNAIKFNDGTPKIKISSSRQGDRVVFRVQDNGIGIKPADFDRIFGTFKRLHPAEAYGGGTGVGLALCQSIANLWSGKLVVESVLGTGSQFSFSCPAVSSAVPYSPVQELER